MAKVVIKEFDSSDAARSEICRRARLVLGSRGYKNANRIRVCTNPLDNFERDLKSNENGKLEITDDNLAKHAVAVADETSYWDIEYF